MENSDSQDNNNSIIPFSTINELVKLLTYNNKKINYLIDKDGEFWFRGKDVAEVLGYTTNESLKKSLQENITKENKCNYGNLNLGEPSTPQVKYDSRTVFINEIGLYLFTFSSKASLAKEFKLWSANVIKEIRKYGEYKLQSKITTLDRMLQEQIETNKKLDVINSNLLSSSEKVENKLLDSNNKLDNLTSENKNIKNKLLDSNNKLDKLTSENKNIEKQLIEANNKLESISSKRKEDKIKYKNEIDNLNTNILNLTSKVSELKISLARSTSRVPREVASSKQTFVLLNLQHDDGEG